MYSENNKGSFEGHSSLQNPQNCPPPNYNDVNRSYEQPMVPGPSVVYVESFAPARPNPPIYQGNNSNLQYYPTVMRTNYMDPYSHYRCQRRTARLMKIGEQRIYLEEKYPTNYAIIHSVVIFLMALGQIIPEYFLVSENSFLSALTSGWYCGGFMIGCTLVTACTTCSKHPIFVKIVVIYNVGMILTALCFAIIAPCIEIANTGLIPDGMTYKQCMNYNFGETNMCRYEKDYTLIINMNIIKMVSGFIIIKMCIFYSCYIINIFRKRTALSASYVYANPNGYSNPSFSNSYPQNNIISS